ncbi:hypothetical protein JVU11DRAFT_12732 [Chiua virens]|nr:hypothetical protein JVU11DRAFT_12732 [Chiua virens]
MSGIRVQHHPPDALPRSSPTSPSKRGVGDVPLKNESVEMCGDMYHDRNAAPAIYR